MGKSESAPVCWEAELIWVRRALNEFDTFVSDWGTSALYLLTCACDVYHSIYKYFRLFAGVWECRLAHTNTELT